MALDESRRSEKRLDDHRQRLESSLDGAGAELSDARLRLSAAEGRVVALETQLARVEAARGDVESKLMSIVSGLRRSIGFTGPLRARSPSPTRSRPTGPTKGQRSMFLVRNFGMQYNIWHTGLTVLQCLVKMNILICSSGSLVVCSGH